MPRSRRDVKFAHRGGSGTRPRRASQALSDLSDGDTASDRESPSPQQSRNGGAPGKHNHEPPQSAFEKKKQTFITRAIWTVLMIGGFIGAILAGHIYMIILVTAIQVVSFREVVGIIDVPSRGRSLRFTKSLNWYFLGTAMYFLYGESVLYYFKQIVMVDKIFLPFATHHRFISFMLYMIGFVFFVGSLQKGNYRFQFTQFGWTHIALYLIVVQAHFVINNIFEGMIWCLLPASLVITNDIFAYICGITFGRTQLIKLSPKKTVEGFIGAWVFTLIFGFGIANMMMRFKYFICPVNVRPSLSWSETNESGPRGQLLHRPPLPGQPRLHQAPLRAALRPARLDAHPAQLRRRAAAVPRPDPLHLCVSDRALWRLLCLWHQAHLPHQGLWRLHSRPRRHHRPHGLPVHHGHARLHVLPGLHHHAQGERRRRHRDGHHGAHARGADGRDHAA
jgi:CDP-diglyceride synthetase